MKVWEDIVNKATLGSAKQALKIADLPELIVTEFNLSEAPDVEENFLSLSSLVYQFRQAGALPSNFSAVTQAIADEETKPHSTAKATAVLKTILNEGHYSLLELWLKRCAEKGWCVEPEIIPQLFDIATERKDLTKLINEISGKRGEWLSTLNPRWNFFSAVPEETTLWETGTPAERKALLFSLRETKPEDAVELLKTTWATEGVNEKVSFLETLKINLSPADLVWLESLNEKGQKVNRAIADLLKLIPSSAILQIYYGILKSAVNIRTEKAFLGMINKKSIEISESISFPESIFKTDIEKLSSDKNVSDSQYILVQLIASVPPSFWNDHLHESSEEIIQLLQKERNTAFYLPALAIAAVKFGDQGWIKNILDYGNGDIIRVSIVSLIGALSGEDRDRYARKFINGQPSELIPLLVTNDREWSTDLATSIIKFTANEVYSYNKSFYRSAVALIPVDILHVLDSFIPIEEQKKVYWKNQSDELARLLSIKQQTLQSFIS